MTSTGQLFAGAGMADISPEFDIQLAGDIGHRRPCKEIRDRIYAKVIVLESEGKRCCIISTDLTSSSERWSDKVRKQAGEVLNISPEAVVFHTLQNHAAPSLGNGFVKDECTLFPPEYPWLRGGDDRYNPFCAEQCLNAVKEALVNLQPVTVSANRMADGRMSFNRRFIMRDGTVRTHPVNCDPDILQNEGPVDPEVGVLLLTGADGKVVASLLHHTCHPTYGYPHNYVIGDWPGIWSKNMQENLGGVAPVINGCCGNIAPINHIDPNWSSTHYEMADQLTETAMKVVANAKPIDALPLKWEQKKLRLPLRMLTSDVIENAQKIIDEYPTPNFTNEEKTRVDWDWIYAAATLDLKDTQDKDPFCDYEIQAFRVGDFALVTVMGEAFVEAQLQIKLESPAPYTYVAHLCNGYGGYVPTAEAMKRGGYETRTANWSKFEPDALETITREAIEMLKRLWA
jgi:hypothetical protein